MIAKRTVLVLGAGASQEYQFPLGRGLRDLVCGLSGAAQLAVAESGFRLDDISEFLWTLCHFGVGSVDWFLEERPEFSAVGKAAMAAALIPFEEPMALFPPRAPTAHWYELLFNALLTPEGDLDKTRLSVVTFNYDRSLEYYLFRVLATRWGSEEEAAEEVRKFEIVHVHGQLGTLHPLDAGGRPYSSELSADAIRKAAAEVLVVGEASGSEEGFEKARALLRQAERVVFLGFGFHHRSVERLGLFSEPWDDNMRARIEVRATSRGIPDHAWSRICEETLAGAIPPRVARRVDPVFKYLFEREPLDL